MKDEELQKFQTIVADELPQGTPLSPNGEFTLETVKKLIKDAVRLGVNWKKDMEIVLNNHT